MQKQRFNQNLTNIEEDRKYHKDTRSEDEMINDLGILYEIFGSTYQTSLNNHTYKIRFKKHAFKSEAFCRVFVDIYEDDIRICKDVILGFWPFNIGNDRCGYIEFTCMNSNSKEKYNNTSSSLYMTLFDGLKEIWNLHFVG